MCRPTRRRTRRRRRSRPAAPRRRPPTTPPTPVSRRVPSATSTSSSRQRVASSGVGGSGSATTSSTPAVGGDAPSTGRPPSSVPLEQDARACRPAVETVRSHGPARPIPAPITTSSTGDGAATIHAPHAGDGHEHPRARSRHRPSSPRRVRRRRTSACGPRRGPGPAGCRRRRRRARPAACPSSAPVSALRVVGCRQGGRPARPAAATRPGRPRSATARPAGRRRPRWPTGRPTPDDPTTAGRTTSATTTTAASAPVSSRGPPATSGRGAFGGRRGTARPRAAATEAAAGRLLRLRGRRPRAAPCAHGPDRRRGRRRLRRARRAAPGPARDRTRAPAWIAVSRRRSASAKAAPGQSQYGSPRQSAERGGEQPHRVVGVPRREVGVAAARRGRRTAARRRPRAPRPGRSRTRGAARTARSTAPGSPGSQGARGGAGPSARSVSTSAGGSPPVPSDSTSRCSATGPGAAAAEDAQEQALPRARHVDRCRVVGPDLQRPEDRDAHDATLGRGAPGRGLSAARARSPSGVGFADTIGRRQPTDHIASRTSSISGPAAAAQSGRPGPLPGGTRPCPLDCSVSHGRAAGVTLAGRRRPPQRHRRRRRRRSAGPDTANGCATTLAEAGVWPGTVSDGERQHPARLGCVRRLPVPARRMRVGPRDPLTSQQRRDRRRGGGHRSRGAALASLREPAPRTPIPTPSPHRRPRPSPPPSAADTTWRWSWARAGPPPPTPSAPPRARSRSATSPASPHPPRSGTAARCDRCGSATGRSCSSWAAPTSTRAAGSSPSSTASGRRPRRA